MDKNFAEFQDSRSYPDFHSSITEGEHALVSPFMNEFSWLQKHVDLMLTMKHNGLQGRIY